MATNCEHTKNSGLCKLCSDKKVYMEFRFENGVPLGYFWGPGYSVELERGKRPYWSHPPVDENK